MVNKRVQNAVFGCSLKNDRMLSVRFQGKPLNITVIQVYAPTSNAEEAEVERFYENLQDFSELTLKKDVLFIIGDWNAQVGSQETPRVTGKFGLGMWNEAGQRLIEFCQENTLVIADHMSRAYPIHTVPTLLQEWIISESNIFLVVDVKSLQICSTVCNKMDCSPSGSRVHGSLVKNTGVGCYFLLQGILRILVFNLNWQM